MTNKYELTNEITEWNGVTLYRIKSLRDIKNEVSGIIIKKGQLGGWVDSVDRLSQDWNCWIGEHAIVYGKAKVYEDAYVYEDAKSGQAEVFGNSMVKDYAQVSEQAQVFGNSQVRDDAVLVGDVIVSGDTCIGGRDVLSGDIHIECNEQIKEAS